MARDAKIARNIQPLMAYRNMAWKCWKCGFCRTAFPEELAGFAVEARLEEARETGARTLVTACAFCEQNLGEDAKRTHDRYGMEVRDILELVHQAR